MKFFRFPLMEAFLTWKEREEEITYTTYVKIKVHIIQKAVDGMY